MPKERLIDACQAVSVSLLKHCETNDEKLVALAHVTAACLSVGKLSPEEVTGYLITITRMLDGNFDR